MHLAGTRRAGTRREPARLAASARDCLDLAASEADLDSGRDDLTPCDGVDRHAVLEAGSPHLSLGLAGRPEAVGTRRRWRRRRPGDERFHFPREVGGGAKPGWVDQDREHAVEHAPAPVGDRAGRLAAGQRAAEQLADEGQAGALVLAERQDRAGRLDHRKARLGGRVAVVVDDRSGRELLALVEGDPRLALGDLAGREVEHDRLVAWAWNADTEWVGAEPRVAPAEGSDDRP